MRIFVALAALSISLISVQSMACEKGNKDKSKLQESESSNQSKEVKKGEKKEEKIVLKEKNVK